ncbi:MAG: polyprenyl diphosphate synthase [bacterium]|jgi:undecaprenyl diphosphate synthase|nr:polyprenyl diphosphate synthase [bacterium]
MTPRAGRASQRPDLPRHVAIIMDGNGRWARTRGMNRVAGHREGIHSVREVVEVCGELGIQVLTLYTFSSENWRRPPMEVRALMSLLMRTISAEADRLHANKVQVRAMGCLEDLPVRARQGMEQAIALTRHNEGLILNLALSYGARQEILRAVNRLLAEGVETVDEAAFAARLFTAGLPDPDLLIRTGGEYRLSNFMLWQLAYTELYISDKLWPEFRREELERALAAYAGRERRFGRTSEQLQP